MRSPLGHVRAVLLDIDGVLTVSWKPIPGAPEALARLRAAGIPVLLVSNTTELTRARLTAGLREAGFEVEPREVVTAPVLTASYLRAEHPGARCLVLSAIDLSEDLEGVEMVRDGADVVVVGGATEPFGADDASLALRAVLDGAPLVAMHRSIAWMTDRGMMLDAGVTLVAGLEEATGRRAVVCGKPAPESFRQCLSLLGRPAGEVAMVGDDVRNDVRAGQAVGLTGVLVRTGKFRPADLEGPEIPPDAVLDSVADLPALLG